MEGFIVGRHRHLDIAIRSCLQTELIAYTLGCLNDIVCVCVVCIYIGHHIMEQRKKLIIVKLVIVTS